MSNVTTSTNTASNSYITHVIHDKSIFNKMLKYSEIQSDYAGNLDDIVTQISPSDAPFLKITKDIKIRRVVGRIKPSLLESRGPVLGEALDLYADYFHTVYWLPDQDYEAWHIFLYIEKDEDITNTNYTNDLIHSDWDFSSGTPDSLPGLTLIQKYVDDTLTYYLDLRQYYRDQFIQTGNRIFESRARNLQSVIDYLSNGIDGEWIQQEMDIPGLKELHENGWTGKGIKLTSIDFINTLPESHGGLVKTILLGMAPGIDYSLQGRHASDVEGDITYWENLLKNNDVVTCSASGYYNLYNNHPETINQIIKESDTVVVFSGGNSAAAAYKDGYPNPLEAQDWLANYHLLGENVLYVTASKFYRNQDGNSTYEDFINRVDGSYILDEFEEGTDLLLYPDKNIALRDSYITAPSNIVAYTGSKQEDNLVSRRGYWGGTSFAAPRAAALAALLRQKYPNLSAKQIVRLIKETCTVSKLEKDNIQNRLYEKYGTYELCPTSDNKTKSCTDSLYGHGFINAKYSMNIVDLRARKLYVEAISKVTATKNFNLYWDHNPKGWTHKGTFTSDADGIEYTLYINNNTLYVELFKGTSVHNNSTIVFKSSDISDLMFKEIIEDSIYTNAIWKNVGWLKDTRSAVFKDRNNDEYIMYNNTKTERLYVFRFLPGIRHDKSTLIADTDIKPFIN